MPKKDRARIDYMPGQAAFDALGLASELFPTMRPQALIDKLLITGLRGGNSLFPFRCNGLRLFCTVRVRARGHTVSFPSP